MASGFALLPFTANPGYYVRLIDNTSGLVYTATARTNAMGRWDIPGVPDGHYSRYQSADLALDDDEWTLVDPDHVVNDPDIIVATVSDGAITTVKLADNSVTSAKIVNGTIVSADIAAGTIAADRLAFVALTNPMTTAEDLIVGGASGAPARKAKGAEGTVLQVVASALSWQPISSAPAGPAGGMLSGSYPAPSIANATIKAAHIAPDAHIPESVLDLDSYLSLTKAQVQDVASNVEVGGGVRVTGTDPSIPAAATVKALTLDYNTALNQGYLQVIDPASGYLPLNVRSNRVLIGQRPDVTADYALLSLGSGLFTGGGAPHFVGSAQGTHLGINAVAAFSGNLIDAQASGVSLLALDTAGQLTVAGIVAGGSTGVFGNAVTSGVVGTHNVAEMLRGASGGPVVFFPAAASIDTNVDVQVTGKGTGKVQASARGAGAVGLEVKLAASPTAHALDVSSSSGTADLLYVDQSGNLVAAGGLWAGQALANQAKLLGSATGVAVTLTAIGSDTNIPVKVVPKGTGAFQIGGTIPVSADGDARLVVDANGNVHKETETWRDMPPFSCLNTVGSSVAANTWLLTPNTQVALGTAGGAGAVYYIDPTWLALNGRTLKVRVLVTLSTDTVAPGINFTFALAPVATYTRASNTRTAVATVGASICSVAINTPAANTTTHAESAAATLSAADYYVLIVTTSGTSAANSTEDFNIRLQYQLI